MIEASGGLGLPQESLAELAGILGIEIVDHIIIGDGSYESLKEGGYL